MGLVRCPRAGALCVGYVRSATNSLDPPRLGFDLPGATRIEKYVLNHSFMIPGLVATSVAVMVGLRIEG